MQITGTIQTIIYRNADNGWTVLELTAENGERLSAVGTLPLCAVGERVELEGAFVTHPALRPPVQGLVRQNARAPPRLRPSRVTWAAA